MASMKKVAAQAKVSISTVSRVVNRSGYVASNVRENVLRAMKKLVTAKTRLGRNIYALGGNREAAFFSGIDIKLHTLIVFMISGLCSGLAGVLSTARLGAAEPAAGQNFETYAIASAIIGGTSFFGGKGRIPSVVVGGLIIGTISNGLNMLRIQTFYQLVVMGSLIIIAVSIDRLIGKGK